MRTVSSLLGAALLVFVAPPLGAQSKPSAEIGTMVGVTILSASGESITHLGIPGAGIQAQPTIYATFFATPSLMIEPQLALMRLSDGGSSLTSVGASVQVGYLFTPAARNSGYVAANVGLQRFSDGGSVSGAGVGGSVGYRVRIGTGLAVRFQTHYRRWLGDFDGLNEFGFGIGLGGII